MNKNLIVINPNNCSKAYIDSVVDCHSNNSIIVYGPMACGKTTNAEKLAKEFNLSVVFDGVTPSEFKGNLPLKGVLVLTTEPPPYSAAIKAISFSEAIKL